MSALPKQITLSIMFSNSVADAKVKFFLIKNITKKTKQYQKYKTQTNLHSFNYL